MTGVKLTSVSSVFSSSCPLAGELLAEERDQKEGDGTMDECARCRPAFSRSGSVQERMVARRESISNRLASARGVVRNARRTFVTRRRSTLVSEELRLSRRRASMRCSLIITASQGEVSVRPHRNGYWEKDRPSCRSFPMSRFFSFTSFSNSRVRETFVCDSSN